MIHLQVDALNAEALHEGKDCIPVRRESRVKMGGIQISWTLNIDLSSFHYSNLYDKYKAFSRIQPTLGKKTWVRLRKGPSRDS